MTSSLNPSHFGFYLAPAFLLLSASLLAQPCLGIPVSPLSPSFEVLSDQFVKDGVPIRILSGELHYFRIPRAYWRDRLLRTKALGFNAIQTYVPWNYHETKRGMVDFTGEKDLFAFLKLASELDLMVLLRPGA